MPDLAYNADIVIVGAGPSGSVLAALLVDQGLDVLLVDRAALKEEAALGAAHSRY